MADCERGAHGEGSRDRVQGLVEAPKTQPMVSRTGAAADSAVGAGDRFAQVVREHGPALYRYAFALCRESGQAEDLVQETFLRGWRAITSLRETGKVKSWLYTTLRREYLRQFEKQRPTFVEVDPDHTPGKVERPDSDSQMLRDGILALPIAHREVLALQVIGGYSGTEIGQMLDLPRATVNTRLFRARLALKRLLTSERGVHRRTTPPAPFRRRR